MEPHGDANKGTHLARITSGGKLLTDGPQELTIPNHELLRRIGSGSYGEVWLARDRKHVFRAIKIVHRKTFRHEGPFQRELAGIQVFAPISRSHLGLIQILGFGSNDQRGYFYYVMELGDDRKTGQNTDPLSYLPRTLASEIALRGKLPFNECVHLGVSLSLALHKLHVHGLVHRDVKPSNIIFVKGIPKLADIGLLAEVSESLSYVGTEGFIPPEGPGTPQADIYSLGKVLYEAATGKDRQDFPELPTLLDGLEDRDAFLELNEIIVCACTNDIAQRYSSAADLHSDFLRLARGESVRRRHQFSQRLAHLRNAVLLTVSLFTGLILLLSQFKNPWSRAGTPQQNHAAAPFYGNDAALNSGDFLGALPELVTALQSHEGNKTRQLQDRLRIGSALCQSAKLEQLWLTTNDLAQAVLSRDGEKILLLDRNGNIRAYDARSGIPVDCSLPAEHVDGIEFSPDGHQLLIVREGGIACVWDFEHGQQLVKLESGFPVHCAQYSPDGSRIVTGALNGKFVIWDSRTGKAELLMGGHNDAILFAAFSHDGKKVVTAGRDKTARIWDARRGEPMGPPLAHPEPVNRAEFSPDDQTLLTVCSDTKARIWDVKTGRKLPSSSEHRKGVLNAGFSPDGRWIAASMVGGITRFWQADAVSSSSWNPLPTDCVQVCFDGTGRRVLSRGEDGAVRLWNLAGCRSRPEPAGFRLCSNGSKYLVENGDTLSVFDAFDRPMAPSIHCNNTVRHAELNLDGRFLITFADAPDGGNSQGILVQVWDTATSEPVGPGIQQGHLVDGIALSPDGNFLLTFCGPVAQCWTVRTGKALGPTLVHDSKISAATFDANGTRILTASGSQVHVRDTASGAMIFPPLHHPAPVAHAEFTGDATRLVTCCADEDISSCFARVWDSATGRPIGPPLRHNDGVLFAGFSADGKRVATASEDFTAGIWDAASGRQLSRRCEHEHHVQTARFSPDGTWLVTASQDKSARIWNAETGEPLTPPLRHTARLVDAKFVADGRRIFTSDVQGHSWVWKLAVDERPAADLRIVARVFTEKCGLQSSGPPAPETEPLPVVWKRIRAKYPAEFSVSPAETASWHEGMARECESEKKWFAAAFHLQHLLELRPSDAALVDRLERARKQMRASPSPESAGTDEDE